MAGRLHGTMSSIKGNFGFIQQDNGQEDMFVMPVQCQSFGGALPPLGARVVYDVVLDQKTGRPRAENVVPEELETQQVATPSLPDPVDAVFNEFLAAAESGEVWYAGKMLSENGKFGFIQQDSGEADMFVMPLQCEGFSSNFPPIGERVVYKIGVDPKTGRPRAENVLPETVKPEPVVALALAPPVQARAHAAPVVPRHVPVAIPTHYPAPMMQMRAGGHSGTVVNNRAKYAFVKQDSGGDDIFLMPVQCQGFGGFIPPDGTRVTYNIGLDHQKGLPTAEDVHPEQVSLPFQQPPLGLPPPRPVPFFGVQQHTQALPAGGKLAGTMAKTNGKFGFIQQDNGQEDMFVMPIQCQAFGGDLPAIGARVVYDVAQDPKTGRPRAENVQPESQQMWSNGWGKAQGMAKGVAYYRPY